MDDTKCMVNIAKFYLEFTVSESCGKCTPCRIGTKRLLETLQKICDGRGEMTDIQNLKELSENIIKSSVCGLGQTAPNPVVSTMRYFMDEYIEHVQEHKCRARECKNLTTIEIDEEKCKGCDLCKKACPVQAISGELRQAHKIDQTKCIKCRSCVNACPFKAIN